MWAKAHRGWRLFWRQRDPGGNQAGQQGQRPTATPTLKQNCAHPEEGWGFPHELVAVILCVSPSQICACQLPVFPSSHWGWSPKPSSGSVRELAVAVGLSDEQAESSDWSNTYCTPAERYSASPLFWPLLLHGSGFVGSPWREVESNWH